MLEMENYNEAEVQGKMENGDLLSLDVDAYEQDDFEERFINKIDAALNEAEHKLQRDILVNEVEENLSKLRYSYFFENPVLLYSIFCCPLTSIHYKLIHQSFIV